MTGAAGFVGRHALRHLLERGFAVHGVDLGPAGDWAIPGVETHRCDLMDGGAVAALLRGVRPSHLLHLAWTTEPGAYWESPENLSWVAASLGLLREFAACGGERAAMAGSCAEYDWNHARGVEGETPLRPTTLYGTAKCALHAVAEKFCAGRGGAGGIGLAWGRLYFPYGPHEHPARLVPSVIRSLLAGEEALCTHGRQVRDFIYVDDAAAAFAALLDSAVEGPVNIASGEDRPLSELIGFLGEELGRPELIRLGTREAPPNDVPVLTADIARLRNEVGYSPPTSLATGLRECVSWWRTQSRQENSIPETE